MRNLYKEVEIFGVERLKKKVVFNMEILFLMLGWGLNLGENDFYLFVYLLIWINFWGICIRKLGWRSNLGENDFYLFIYLSE